MFDFRKNKYILVIGFILVLSLAFLNWNNRKYAGEERPAVDIAHKLIFLPDSGLSYKDLQMGDTSNWDTFTGQEGSFSFGYPADADFNVDRRIFVSEKYNIIPENNPLYSDNIKEMYGYNATVEKTYSKEFGGPHAFVFTIREYSFKQKSPLKDYLKDFAGMVGESTPVRDREIVPFITCKPVSFFNSQGQMCSFAYKFNKKSFYIAYKDRLFVIDNLMTRDYPYSPPWSSEEPAVRMGYEEQQRLLFETIVSTFKVLD